MKIQSLQYEDLSTGWKLDLIEFNPQLTLLVGASGVGKTQILKALLNLKKVSQGASLNGLRWKVVFTTTQGQECEWTGGFENKGFFPSSIFPIFEDDEKKDKFSVEYEYLDIDEYLIINRNQDGIEFEGHKTVKLSQQESALFLLKEEDKVKQISEEFRKIIIDNNSMNQSHSERLIFDDDLELKIENYKTLAEIRNSDEDINTKLYLVYERDDEIFSEITEAFINIFPSVQKIRIEPIDSGNKKIHPFLRNAPLIQIRERNVREWIDVFKMSSGMYRALIHIAELYLCADSSVILIDEFENSLGINCINEITSSILASERDLQFIITSHHPYIINNIGYSHWKLVTRNGSVITAENATKYGIGKSKHQAFTQLANLDEFSEGIVF